MSDLITAIDLGSSKVCVIVADMDRHGRIQVLGMGRSHCNGIKKGVVVDIEETTKAIMEAISQAENMSNIEINQVYINLAGGLCRLTRNKGVIAVTGEDREITTEDVKRVLNSATIVSIPQEEQLIDVIPTQYVVDGYDEIMDPIGMTGVRLEVDADIITGSATTVLNLVKAVNRSGVEVLGIIMEPLATSEAVLTSDAKEMGVLLIDCGAGTTDLTYFKNGKVMYSNIVPVGGYHITNDISVALRIPFDEGEDIKVKHGSVDIEHCTQNDEEIEVNQIGSSDPTVFNRSELSEIVEVRVSELFNIVKADLQKQNINGHFVAGVVITGGGLSYIHGITELAKNIFETNAQIGYPKVLGANEPVYATSVGIAKYILKRKYNYHIEYNSMDVKKPDLSTKEPIKNQKNSSKSNFTSKLKTIFKDYF